jgi:hypothetical protein
MEPVGFVREHTEIGTHDRLKRLLRGHFSEADLTKLLAEGAALAEDRAVDEALLPEIAIR